MVSHFTDQFDPLAGSETTLDMVSGLPQRIARARIEAAAALASEVLERARTPLPDHSPASRRRNAVVPGIAGEIFTLGAELIVISLCFGAIAAGMFLNIWG
ncbi:hypothetical protein [Novosphingobium sp.]|uniref:hypothetical protein n=1 Tax=Novosphingobium sp. TaxID=1874826 RepID=UPI003BAD32AE